MGGRRAFRRDVAGRSTAGQVADAADGPRRRRRPADRTGSRPAQSRERPDVAIASGSACPACTTRRPARRGCCQPRRRWDGVPVAATVGGALGLPVAMINDARAFGLAELRLGAGRGASIDGRPHARDRRGRRDRVDGRVHQGHDGTGGELGHQTLEPDGPCVHLRQQRLPRGASARRPDRGSCAARPRPRRRSVARARATPRAIAGLAEIGRYLGIGIANMIVVMTPDKVVIGGGISGRRRPAHGADHARGPTPRDDDLARRGRDRHRRARDVGRRHRRRRPRRGVDGRDDSRRSAGARGRDRSMASCRSRATSSETSSWILIGPPAVPFIAPGFVDLHVHGWGGHDAMGGRDGAGRHGTGAAAPRRDVVPADSRDRTAL